MFSLYTGIPSYHGALKSRELHTRLHLCYSFSKISSALAERQWGSGYQWEVWDARLRCSQLQGILNATTTIRPTVKQGFACPVRTIYTDPFEAHDTFRQFITKLPQRNCLQSMILFALVINSHMRSWWAIDPWVWSQRVYTHTHMSYQLRQVEFVTVIDRMETIWLLIKTLLHSLIFWPVPLSSPV